MNGGAKEIGQGLRELLREIEPLDLRNLLGVEITDIQSFDDSFLLWTESVTLLRIRGGAEFQIWVKQSKGPRT